LAIWILISGIDDLFITLVAWLPRREFTFPGAAALVRTPERRIALFVPLWREHGVIERMLAHNLAAIRYSDYEVFVGVYPNDPLTLRAVADQARRRPNVHITMCPHDGPTSKGDCLNAIYDGMCEYEVRNHIRFDLVVMHDAEDVVHPESLRLINFFSRKHAMVQIPVLPLATPAREFTHGLYCDEFAEYQRKDIPVRQALGGFLPSNGVGTGFDRDALEDLATRRSGRPFDPACLTEDYETGYRLYALGYSQIFVPVQIEPDGPVATREYFPQTVRRSIAQRTRWVTGIALQGWQHHGWPVGQAYWFWRDRKGIAGNLLSPFANVLCLYGALRHAAGGPIAALLPAWLVPACEVTCAITVIQIAVRAHSASAIYGWGFAALTPLRMLWGNLVNFAATAIALWDFFDSRWRGKGLAWRKTDHVYPTTVPALATGIAPYRQTVSSAAARESG
jgi:adsorption protein B